MRNKDIAKVLITGATGFIGGVIAERWVKKGITRPGDVQLRALVRDPNSTRARKLAELGVLLLPGDLADLDSLAHIPVGCDVVIHSAADTVMKSPKLTWKVAVDATRALYDQAAGSDVKRFIFISSMAVYGGMDGEIGESVLPVPWGDLYADSKIAAERTLLERAQADDRPELTILRFPFVYGIESFRWTLEPLEQARKGQLYIPGRGLLPTPYLYVENMVEAVRAAVTSPNTGIYNVFDGGTSYFEFMQYYADMVGREVKHISPWLFMGIATLVELFSKVTGRFTPLNRRTARRMLAETSGSWPAPEKAIQELGWQPRVNLQEGMAQIEKQVGDL